MAGSPAEAVIESVTGWIQESTGRGARMLENLDYLAGKEKDAATTAAAANTDAGNLASQSEEIMHRRRMEGSLNSSSNAGIPSDHESNLSMAQRGPKTTRSSDNAASCLRQGNVERSSSTDTAILGGWAPMRCQQNSEYAAASLRDASSSPSLDTVTATLGGWAPMRCQQNSVYAAANLRDASSSGSIDAVTAILGGWARQDSEYAAAALRQNQEPYAARSGGRPGRVQSQYAAEALRGGQGGGTIQQVRSQYAAPELEQDARSGQRLTGPMVASSDSCQTGLEGGWAEAYAADSCYALASMSGGEVDSAQSEEVMQRMRRLPAQDWDFSSFGNMGIAEIRPMGGGGGMGQRVGQTYGGGQEAYGVMAGGEADPRGASLAFNLDPSHIAYNANPYAYSNAY